MALTVIHSKSSDEGVPNFLNRENNSIIVLHKFAPTNMQVVLFVNRQMLMMSAGALNIGSIVGPNLRTSGNCRSTGEART